MKQYRTAKQVHRFDIFKVITFCILVVLLFLTYNFLRPIEPAPASTVAQATSEAQPPLSQTEPTAESSPNASTETTAEPDSEIQTPDSQAEPTTASNSNTSGETTAEPAPANTTDPNAAATAEPAATASASENENDAAVETALTLPILNLSGSPMTSGQVELTGAGEPGSEVEIVVNGQPVGKTTVGSDGKWSFAADLPDAGEYQVSVQSLAADGKVLAAGEAVTLTVVGATESEADEATVPTLDMPGGELSAGQVELTGTGEPGSDVEIMVDGQPVGTTTVSSGGEWQIIVFLPQAGEYEVEVQGIDAAGNMLAVSQPATLTVAEAESEPTETVAEAPSEQADGQAYIVQADDWLSKLALKFYNDMTQYPAIVEATNAKAKTDSSFAVITNPDLIEIGQKLWIPASPQ